MIDKLIKRRTDDHSQPAPSELEFQRLKTVIHEELIESLDLSVVAEIDERILGEEIHRLATKTRENVTEVDEGKAVCHSDYVEDADEALRLQAAGTTEP